MDRDRNSPEKTTRPQRSAAAALLAAMLALLCCLALPAPAHADEEASSGEDELQKIETPTATKTVWDGEAYSTAADAGSGEAVWYRIAGTLPSNLDDFEAYAYEFHDCLDAALVVDETTIRVEIIREGELIEDATELFETTLSENDEGWELVVATEDLLQAATELETDDTVVLTYAASIDAEIAESGAAIVNYAYLRYTSKAFTDAFGKSVETSTSLYTWSLEILKTDKDTGLALTGAAFTVQDEDGLYLAADGSLSEEEVLLEVDEEGSLVISTLDSGFYTVTEAEPPEGYEAAESFQLLVSADLSGTSPALSASVDDAEMELSVDAETGSVSLVVADEPEAEEVFEFPQTGDVLRRIAPVAVGVLVVAGCGAACAAIARRRDRRG